MPKEGEIVFGTFRLDLADERLWDGHRNVHLGHKSFAVLTRLLRQPGQLVSKDDLLEFAWPETAVSEAVLTTAMRELRQALADDARMPRFIETVHGRGYRFIAAVADGAPKNRFAAKLVGRENESARLREWYGAARQGSRRIALIAGEAGIGKTALVDQFASEVSEAGDVLVGRGQCIEHYGSGEAYLPVLEALGRLGRDAGAPLTAILRAHAPSWLAHLPSLAAGEAAEAPVQAAPARMLRELADALEVLTAGTPLILVLEDLHWSDTATLEWLAYAARRHDAARLLVLATYRPLEAALHHHPLRRLAGELRQQPHSPELVLDHLSGDAVEIYLRLRLGDIPELRELAGMLHRRTGGHPLFLTAIADELLRKKLAAGGLADVAKLVPASVRQFIEHRIEELPSGEREILEVASVAGDPFTAAAVAAAAAVREETAEELCTGWAIEGRYLTTEPPTTWPGGTQTARYRFRHALYQEVLYTGIPPERRARAHRAIGRRLETACGKRAAAIAAELAMHFEQGHEFGRALPYFEQAARNALDRSAYTEARGHLERARALLHELPHGRPLLRRELELLLLLGRVLAATKGWAVSEVESVFLRARDLAGQLHDPPRLLQALWGLIGVTFVGAEFQKANALGREVLKLAVKRRDPIYTVLGHMEAGGTLFHLGVSPEVAARHFSKAEAAYDPRQHRSHIAAFGVDMGVFSRSWEAHFLWLTGHPAHARAKAQEALRLSREVSHPLSCAVALAYAAMLHQFCRDARRVETFAEEAIRLCTRHGFRYYLAWAETLRGWSRAASGAPQAGAVEIRRGIEALEATAGARMPYYRALLAEACAWGGRTGEALQALDQAASEMQRSHERWWDPELDRLRGELLPAPEAEACFQRAIASARSRKAGSLEIRAAVSLGRLWLKDGRTREATRLLREVQGRLGEGFDTSEVQLLLNAPGWEKSRINEAAGA